jgi:hypothetical protein
MWRRSLLVILFAASSLHAQQPKNVKVLVGMSRPEVQRAMNLMRAGLGVHCHYCHVAGQDPSVDGTPQKARAREMMQMVVDVNQRLFGGKPVVTCFTCHNGSPHPKLAPPLPQPLPLDLPANPPVAEAKKLPAASEILQKYIAAVGRIVPPSEPRTIIAVRATPTGGPVAMKIQESGELMRTDLTLPDGTLVTQALTKSGGWILNKSGVHEMNAEDLVNARMGRRAFAPFTETSFPDDATVAEDKIGEDKVWVVGTANARYWFSADSGLLLRRVVFYDTPVGRIPEQTEFDHYRTVGTAKVPFTTRISLVDPWLGGTRQATSIVIGTQIAPSEFEKPQ